MSTNEQFLREAKASLEEFVSRSVHDLKTPLRHICNFAQFVADGASERLTTEENEDLQRVITSSLEMRDMLNRVSDFAKLSSQPLAKVTLAMQGIVDTALATWPDDRKSRIQIGTLPEIYADRGMLIEVFANLLDNAWRYGNQDDSSIQIECVESEHETTVQISDNGEGISHEQFERIFQPGVSGVRGESNAGYGLGLARSALIVRAHGGRIWVDSEVGKGATFSFTVPKQLV